MRLCRQLTANDRQHVFLEGGPTLAAAFLTAGLVDEIVAYVAPMLLGSGRNAVADLGINSIADAMHFTIVAVAVLDPHSHDEDSTIRITMKGR